MAQQPAADARLSAERAAGARVRQHCVLRCRPVFALVATIGKLRKQQMTFVQGDVLDAHAQPLLFRAEATLATKSSLIIVGGSSLLAARLRQIAPATRQLNCGLRRTRTFSAKAMPLVQESD